MPKQHGFEKLWDPYHIMENSWKQIQPSAFNLKRIISVWSFVLDNRLSFRLIFTAMNSGLTRLARTGTLDEDKI